MGERDKTKMSFRFEFEYLGKMVASDKGHRTERLGGGNDEFGLESRRTEGLACKTSGQGCLGESRNSVLNFRGSCAEEVSLVLISLCMLELCYVSLSSQ